MPECADHRRTKIGESIIAVLLGTPDTPCPECDHGLAELRYPDADAPWNVGFPKTGKGMCPRCGGSGVVPGQPALRVPCETCDGSGVRGPMPHWMGEGTGDPCNVCDGSGFGLAAIDVARGAEQVKPLGWIEGAAPVLRFPRRVTGEQT